MPGTLTPLMQQYFDVKQKYQDCILLFRLGDFYEMFFEDAVLASKELEIVLTGRDCGLSERAPMCGVPYHSVEGYISRLIEKGHKIALCEQLSDPSIGKGLVERDVIRVITPGTVIEEHMLDERKNNFLLSMYMCDMRIGYAYADVSTGDFFIGELTENNAPKQILDELAHIQPTEIIANDTLFLQPSLVRSLSSGYYLQNYGSWAYEEDSAKKRLLRHYGVNSLRSFGCENMPLGICAAGALLSYLSDTQKNALPHIRVPRILQSSAVMKLNAATRRNLELTKPLHYEGNKKNTLLNLLDETKTAMGGRMLRAFIEQPLQDVQAIRYRQNAIEALLNNLIQRENLREALSSVYDIERLCSRIAYGTVHARDCIALRATLSKLPVIICFCMDFSNKTIKSIADTLDPLEDILGLLTASINEDPPINMKDGNIIKQGYNNEVDQLRDAAQNGKQWIADFETAEREATGIKNLRISFNKVFGYYIEITKSYQNMVPYHYQRKQTIANAERYITPALKEMEESILNAHERIIALESHLFTQIKEILAKAIPRLQKDASLLAELDVYQALAKVAADRNYCMPAINDNGIIDIKNGRHPVVERSSKDQFIPNNSYLNNEEDRLIILTGPNMAGKSTYMRQVALIVLMAHTGSFVPADEANICLTDSIFTRVGASDDLSAGQSTFMVEMSEMANILLNASSKSLLLLDEIGRGTSTFDGLSIAWAVLEHIADKKLCGAKALFATHYHELTELEGRLAGIKNYRVTVKEVGEDILFLRKVMLGGADKSFGIQVARLACLPESILKRASELLRQLESADINRNNIKRMDQAGMQQLSMLSEDKKTELINELKHLDVDSLSPLEALNRLNDLHNRARLINREAT